MKLSLKITIGIVMGVLTLIVLSPLLGYKGLVGDLGSAIGYAVGGIIHFLITYPYLVLAISTAIPLYVLYRVLRNQTP